MSLLLLALKKDVELSTSLEEISEMTLRTQSLAAELEMC